jgi:hypothetical protein
VAVGSIIVDLVVRDADGALGRDGLCTVKGREMREYLEEYTWLFVRKTRRWLVTQRSAWLDLTYRTSHSGKKAKKRTLADCGGRRGEREDEKSERNLQTDAILTYFRGCVWSNEITLARYSPTRFGTGATVHDEHTRQEHRRQRSSSPR